MQEMPAYQSISFDIAQRIVSGEFPVNTKLSGRSLLASQYHVSPETIRKAMALLKEEQIIDVSQGKEIIIISDQKALSYLTKHQYLKSANSLKHDLEALVKEKRENDQKFEAILNDIIVFSDRLQNLKPYNPVEIKIRASSHTIGKTIANLQFWQNTGATIIALRRGIDISISPGPHVILREDDVLIVIGDEHVYQRTWDFINKPNGTTE